MLPILLGLALAMPSAPNPTKIPMKATYYGDAYHGRVTAAGAHKSKAVPVAHWRFNKNALTAAHRSLEFGTRLLVESGGRSVVVTVTDRGPYPPPGFDDRQLDLSEAAFRALAPLSLGVISVSVSEVNK
jgi:rare lipoprotein A